MRILDRSKRYSERNILGPMRTTNRDFTRERFGLAHPDISLTTAQIREDAAHFTSGETAKAFDPRHRKAFGQMMPITRMNDGSGGSSGGGSSSHADSSNQVPDMYRHSIDQTQWERTPPDERWKLIKPIRDENEAKQRLINDLQKGRKISNHVKGLASDDRYIPRVIPRVIPEDLRAAQWGKRNKEIEDLCTSTGQSEKHPLIANMIQYSTSIYKHNDNYSKLKYLETRTQFIDNHRSKLPEQLKMPSLFSGLEVEGSDGSDEE